MLTKLSSTDLTNTFLHGTKMLSFIVTTVTARLIQMPMSFDLEFTLNLENNLLNRFMGLTPFQELKWCKVVGSSKFEQNIPDRYRRNVFFLRNFKGAK